MLRRKKVAENSGILNARILYYDFFSGFFVFDLLNSRADLLLKQIEILKNGFDENVEDFNKLESEIIAHGTRNLTIEYTRLFMLPFNPDDKTMKKKRQARANPQIILYLSYYLDKTIAGVGLLRARKIVNKSNVRLNEKEFVENEEHFGFLLNFMKHCLKNAENDLAHEVFSECIAPMKDEIISQIKAHEDSHFCCVARILEHFLDFESAMFGFTGVVSGQFH